ncbi:protein PHYTOCHROME KINASE SUBSTRATE 3 [Manihot esculenta]|uniref:Uncharacterized protein n=1 Tax=Manihot esculenta TaxID=3983 RepID=A0A2C9VPD3_MANES|nr:protein PHYTOCHROME KINASE SUBSTRATE 3 [Manihot esculenta]OAY47632.1 hypothetical protein MANES_06G093600v8 [Manihot esculenta]
MDAEIKSTDLRDASFSYLTAAQQNYVVKLTESAQFTHPETISTQDTSIPFNLERTKPEGGEISVFRAEKYFNMKLDDVSAGSMDVNAGKFAQETMEKRVELHRLRSKGSLGTPSVSSESSWNSQTTLLANYRRNSSHSRRKKVNERWFFPGFTCKGSCSDDKSVYIDKSVPHTGFRVARNPIMLEGRKQSQSRFLTKDHEFRSPSFGKLSIGSNREDYLVLPTVNSGVQNLSVKREKQKTLEEDARKSIDVFGSHKIKKEDIASNLERKLSVLTWDAIPFPKAQNLPSTSASSQMYEEAESDASSDLFEIENLSCSTQPMFRNQTSDGISGCMTPPSRYEPSETSIEWSVVTASAADFYAISDYDEKKPAESSTKTSVLASTPRSRRSNILLGCKNEKAVQVAESAYRRSEKAKPHLHEHASTPVMRKLPADSEVKDFDFP